MHIAWQDHIESTPDVLRGKPCIKGTRIPVGLILGYLAEGFSPDRIVSEFPDLNKEQINACLDYARELAEFERDIDVISVKTSQQLILRPPYLLSHVLQFNKYPPAHTLHSYVEVWVI